ncbi:hypothetical protein BT96DRAFT_915300 [Gymnopus androsaceus JB14]|uniref:C2H2-type domain-containing protein n=1 Tax=Gymnopus androsaceus JB14 TaxID=1447944 RepID=A0A6A4ICW8_9AGAR|nr:hypothetical protein BT96DRAFT_915300 [Gymnopus androsaceus JB14]
MPIYDNSFLLSTSGNNAQSNAESTAIRRTRKELFADDFPFHTRYNHSTTSYNNDIQETSYIDPMDLWRTYTKRSVDDREGRTPLTCTWKLGTDEGFIECGYGATPKLMRRHVQTTHMHIKRYRCEICDQAFSQGALLHSHKASKHSQIRPYKCPFEGCDKTYVDCPTLLRHKKINHNYIPKPITRYR